MKKKETAETPVETPVVEEVVKHIAPLTENYGREDLNLMRDKINEIIARVDNAE